MAAAGVGAAGGWGAAQQYNNHQQQQQQQRQASPTWDSPAAYPAMNGAPTSTANLLSSNNGQLSHNEIESREMQQHLDNMRQQQQSTFNKPTTGSANKGLGMMDAGLAGAAGIGAVKIAQQQQQQGEASSPFGDHPGQGSIHVVKRTFEPSLDDELVLFPGNRVQMLIKYDDGWALGINLDSDSNPPAKGVFPFDCLGEVVPSASSTPVVAAPQPQQPLHTITEAETDSRPSSPSAQQQQQQQEPESDSLGYLAYDAPEPTPTHPPSSSSHSSITSQLPPQLPTLRSDSPIDFSSPPPSATAPAAVPLPPRPRRPSSLCPRFRFRILRGRTPLRAPRRITLANRRRCRARGSPSSSRRFPRACRREEEQRQSRTVKGRRASGRVV
ncbi:hypothetical protein BCR35DRAFT_93894 [Leucosporidium creatinivorum]|uniref:SH3 domain-containing protein n=1 Tax=Leucosporidium creatinivorum TaxID=106004 RepID=A0A1Y2F754_9BASI|nr:hypothetical protein BCR35DRAFT_93894 [Leucosporidium creatinivorum]